MDNSPHNDTQLNSLLLANRLAGLLCKLVTALGVVLNVVGLLFTVVPLIVVGAILFIAGGAIGALLKKRAQSRLTDAILPEVLYKTLSDVRLEPKNAIPRQELFRAHMPLDFSDAGGSPLVYATHQGKPITLGGVLLTRQETDYNTETQMHETSDKQVFHGRWMICGLGRPLAGELQLGPRSGLERLLNGKSLKTGRDDFDKRFTLQTGDMASAMSMLTPAVADAILQYADTVTDGKLYLSLLPDGTLHAAVDTGHGWIDPGKGSAAQQRERLTQEIHSFTALVDRLAAQDSLYRKD